MGRVMTDGLEALILHGDSPAVIESVEAVGEGFETLGFLLAGPDRNGRGGNIESFEEFPPKKRSLGPLVPAVGATLLPTRKDPLHPSYELLAGMRITSDEVGLREGIRLTYRVDGKLYEEWIQAKIVLCPEGRDWRAAPRRRRGPLTPRLMSTDKPGSAKDPDERRGVLGTRETPDQGAAACLPSQRARRRE